MLGAPFPTGSAGSCVEGSARSEPFPAGSAGNRVEGSEEGRDEVDKAIEKMLLAMDVNALGVSVPPRDLTGAVQYQYPDMWRGWGKNGIPIDNWSWAPEGTLDYHHRCKQYPASVARRLRHALSTSLGIDFNDYDRIEQAMIYYNVCVGRYKFRIWHVACLARVTA